MKCSMSTYITNGAFLKFSCLGWSWRMLKLKLQYFGHLMRRGDSLEKIEGRRRRGWQRMRLLDGIIDSMDINLSTPQETVKDREAWRAVVHGVTKGWTWLSNWTAMKLILAKPLTQFSSVTQSCSTLCDPIDCSTPGLPVHHQLPESTQTHVHWVGDAIQPSHPLSSPSLPAIILSQHQDLFEWVNSSHPVAKVLEFQFQHQSFQWIFKIDFL